MRGVGRLLQGSLFYIVCACGPVVVGGPTTNVPGNTPRPGIPVTGRAANISGQMKYVCRGATPSGWIAIDYVEDAQACPTSRRRFNTAVVVPLTNTQLGQTLEVCAEERLPANWYSVQNIVDPNRCPTDKPSDARTVVTVREIRRAQ